MRLGLFEKTWIWKPYKIIMRRGNTFAAKVKFQIVRSYKVLIGFSCKVENCGSHILVSGENLRNPPGNHKRRGYCFWSISKIIRHFDYTAILDFGQRNGNHFFNPPVSKI